MFQPWRFQLRQAEAAYQADRLDEACELLCQGNLAEFLPAKKLMAKVAAGLAKRGQTHAESGHTVAGWNDLEAAEHLGAVRQIAGLREYLVTRAVAEAEANLAADALEAALERLQWLGRRGATTQQVRRLTQIAVKLQSARRLARKGQFTQAEAELASAIELRPDLAFLVRRREELRQGQTTHRTLRGDLHDALTHRRWADVVTLAERLLELASDDQIAADARTQAWAAAGMKVEPKVAGALREQIPLAERADYTPRFLMWIDGVGGYLVCEGAETVLGQPVAGSRVDVPILGDLSRNHATIRRSGEGYLIVPRRTTRLEGRKIDDAAALSDGATLDLGHGVRLRFRQPSPLSRTARLDFLSHHRTQPAADGVILLADSCVLGPAANSHVVCPDWRQAVILFRRNNQLYCRADGEYQIDDQSGSGQRPIGHNSRIMSEQFAIKLEASP